MKSSKALIVVLITLWASNAAAGPIVATIGPNDKATVYRAFGTSGEVCFSVVGVESGSPITAEFWSVQAWGDTKDHGRASHICLNYSYYLNLRVGFPDGETAHVRRISVNEYRDRGGPPLNERLENRFK